MPTKLSALLIPAGHTIRGCLAVRLENNISVTPPSSSILELEYSISRSLPFLLVKMSSVFICMASLSSKWRVAGDVSFVYLNIKYSMYVRR